MARVADFGLVALAVGCGLVGGCVAPPAAKHIVGPDGTQMLHVHCGDEQVACFQLAGKLCPSGYFLSPVFDPHDGNFLVRCKDPSGSSALANAAKLPAPAAISATQPARTAQGHPHAPDADWPPAEVARPSEPWPSPSAAAPAPKTAIGNVDIGY